MSIRLFNLSIEHIAGVDRPANKRKFLIIKQEKIEKLSVSKEGNKYCLYDGDKKLGEYDSVEAANAAKAKMSKGAHMLTKEQIAKIEDKDLQEAAVKQQEEMLEQQKKIDSLTKDVETLKAAPPPNTDDESIWKGVPPAIRNRFEAIQKERDEYAAKAKGEKDERETDHHVAKCEQFKYLQITPKHFGKVMKEIAETSRENADEVYRILGIADGLIEKGAFFGEIGVRKDGTKVLHTGDATNIEDRVNALATDYMVMAKNQGKELSMPDAITKVFNEHPDWHVAWRRRGTQSVKVQ